MNKYEALYKGKRLTVEASTSYEAQKLAATQFKAKKSYEVTVMLVELAGEPYVHSAGGI